MGRAVCVFMSVCLRVHGRVGMRIWCQHCMGIEPAFGLITVHTHTKSIKEKLGYLFTIWRPVAINKLDRFVLQTGNIKYENYPNSVRDNR
jgi:hypothetical protein